MNVLNLPFDIIHALVVSHINAVLIFDHHCLLSHFNFHSQQPIYPWCDLTWWMSHIHFGYSGGLAEFSRFGWIQLIKMVMCDLKINGELIMRLYPFFMYLYCFPFWTPIQKGIEKYAIGVKIHHFRCSKGGFYAWKQN